MGDGMNSTTRSTAITSFQREAACIMNIYSGFSMGRTALYS